MSDLKRVRLRVVTVVCMIFIMVSSGAFGIEDMVSSSGPGMTMLLLLVLPLIWALPMALVCSELGSAIPDEGGYYVWVRRALGEFWGFQAGWWSWTCQWVDSAVYIALTVGYIRSWLTLTGFEAWLVGLALIAVFTYMNIRGLEIIAFSSVVFTIVILAPFVGLVIAGFAHWHVDPVSPFFAPGESFFGSLGLGLAVGMWMYSGFDSMSVMAGEVHEPQRVIPKALMISLPLVMASYILPTLAGLAGVGGWADWTTSGGTSFVEAARAVGGPVLGAAMLGAAVISNVALYVDYLASGSRPAFAMAEDGLLPRWLCRIHGKYGTPWVSILFLAAVNAVLIIGTFAQLVVVDVFLMMFYYVLIFVAAVVLRHKEPDLVRPFRIRTGVTGLALIATPPVLIALLALFTNGWDYLIGGVLGAMSGTVAYLVFKSVYGGRRRSGAPANAYGEGKSFIPER